MKLVTLGQMWYEPLFYVPALLSFGFIILGGLTYILGLLSPPFWIEIILELSNSTYEEVVNTCGVANVGLQIIDGLSSNLPFVLLWLGLGWISFMWMMIIPLDHLFCYGIKIRYDMAGKIAYFHAIFWTIATLIIWLYAHPWLIARFLAGILSLIQGC